MPPPPPAPPPLGKMPPKASGGRKDLLGSIEGFKKGKLKKTQTVDKSAPAVAAVKPSSVASSTPSSAGSNSTTSSGNSSYTPSSAGFSAMGGIFAGGVPRLRKTGLPGSSTMLPGASSVTSEEKETRSPTVSNNASKPIPPVIPISEENKTQTKRETTPLQRTLSPPKVFGTLPDAVDSYALVIYPFTAQRDTDLSILPDDILCVTNKHPPGSGNGKWWEGMKLSGERGYFPSNYVQNLETVQKLQAAFDYNAERGDELSLRAGDIVDLFLRRDSGWWFGSCGEKYGLFPSNFIS